MRETKMPGVDEKCTTHHEACECRHAQWMKLFSAVEIFLSNEKEFYKKHLLNTVVETRKFFGRPGKAASNSILRSLDIQDKFAEENNGEV